MPLVVEALDLALHTRDPRRFFPEHPEALTRLQAHARTRHAQGIGLVELVREYTVLRDEVWRLFQRHLPAQLQPNEVLTLAGAINLTLDQVVEASIAAYLAAGAAAGPSDGAASTSGAGGTTNEAGEATDSGPGAAAR